MADFAVESKFCINGINKPLRINYLTSSVNEPFGIREIVEEECKGFKYILTFYSYKK